MARAVLRSTFAIAAGLALTFAANAQTLTKAEEGRKEVGNCYRMCMVDDAADDNVSAILLIDQFWANWHDIETDEVWAIFLTEWKQLVCAIGQAELLRAYGCRYGCLDVELAYGVSVSSARNVFLRAYNDLIAQLKPSGLWVTSDRDRPRPGTDAFATACENYFDSPSAAGGTNPHLDVARELLQRPRPVDKE